MKRCRWTTYHLTVHTVIMHMNKKTRGGGYTISIIVLISELLKGCF